MAETDAPETGHTVIFNPSTGDPWACPNDAVEAWVDLGWKKTAPNKQAAQAAKDVV